jgi:hypothetical protein
MESRNKIDIVAHSMGYAYSKGMLDELKDILAFNNKFGNYYIIAPENAIGHQTSTEPLYRLNTSDFESVFQYGSNFEKEKDCYQDGIAPQVGINAIPPVPNIFIPMTDGVIPGTDIKYKSIRKFLPAHQIKNYGWLFTEPSIPFEARIKTRNN